MLRKQREKKTNYEDLKTQSNNLTKQSYSQSVNLVTVSGGMERMDFGNRDVQPGFQNNIRFTHNHRYTVRDETPTPEQ